MRLELTRVGLLVELANHYTTRDTLSGNEIKRGVLANMLDYDIVVSEFELQSHCYIHFQTNTLGKGMNTLILAPSNRLKSITSVSSTRMALAFNNLYEG